MMRKSQIDRILFTAAISALASAPLVRAGHVSVDNSFGHAGALSGPNYAIDAALGKRVGSNLFFSFDHFDLSQGDIASFSGPSGVHNVLARVTGGPATIDGTLQSRIPHANFYLLDSAGVMFGPDAALDVQGAFVVTTADSVHLGHDEQFAAAASAHSVLSSAPPAAFGFTAPHPAGVTLAGSTLAVPAKQGVSIVGGNIVGAGGTITAPGGAVNLVSVSAPSRVSINLNSARSHVDARSDTTMGTIALADSQIQVQGPGGGAVTLRGGNTTFTDSSITAYSTGNDAGRTIDLGATGELTLSGSVILGGTQGRGNSGAIRVTTTALSLDAGDNGAAGIIADSRTSGAPGGRAGDLQIRAGSVQCSADTIISSNTDNGGAGGEIRVRAESLQLRDGASIGSTTTGSGRGGSLAVAVTGDTNFSGAGSSGLDAGIFATTTGDGDTGNIRFTSNALELSDGSLIASASLGSGRTGDVMVHVAGAADLSGSDAVGHPSSVAVSTRSTGGAGDVRFTAASLQLLDGAAISSATFGPAGGGNVDVAVKGLTTISGLNPQNSPAGILANSNFTGAGGPAGNVKLTTRSLQMDAGGEIGSSTFGAGAGGKIDVRVARDASITGGGTPGADAGVFAATVADAGGDAGAIDFRSRSLHLLGGAEITSSTEGSGRGGSVAVNIAGAATIAGADLNGNDSGILADAFSTSAGAGSAGQISLSSHSLQLLDGAKISSQTFGLGNGGDVSLRVAGAANISGADASSSDAGVFASSNSDGPSGAAGSVRLRARSLQLTGGAQVSSETFGAGNGGDVGVNVAGAVVASGRDARGNFSGLFADTNSRTDGGSAGSIHLKAASLRVLAGAEISSSTVGAGHGGDIDVQVAHQTVFDGSDVLGDQSAIFAITFAPDIGGAGGSIRLSTGRLVLSNGGEINSSTYGSGNGGGVRVRAGQAAIAVGASAEGSNSGLYAATQAQGLGGAAGSIDLRAASLQLLDGGQISSSTAGMGRGGDVRIAVTNQATLSGRNAGDLITGVFADSESQTAGGAAGSIHLSAQSLQVLDGANISSAAFGLGSDAGSVNVFAGQRLLLQDGGTITAASVGGAGGDVHVASGQSILLSDAAITTDAAENGGSIRINAPAQIRLQNGSQILTNSGGANGGNITIDPVEFTLSNSAIHANGGVNGGKINLRADRQQGVVTRGAAANVTATGGTGVSGSIVAVPEQLDIVRSIVPLQIGLEPPVTLAPQCGVHLGDDQSTFVIPGRGGAPVEPGGWTPELKLELGW